MGIKTLVKQILTEKWNRSYERELAARRVSYKQWTSALQNNTMENAVRAEEAVRIFCSEKGQLAQGAEERILRFFQEHPQIQLAYGDEDVWEDGNSEKPEKPWFKPDWSPDTFRSFFYPGSVIAVRTEFLEQSGWEDVQDGKAQDEEAQDEEAQDGKSQDEKVQDEEAQDGKSQDGKVKNQKAQGIETQSVCYVRIMEQTVRWIEQAGGFQKGCEAIGHIPEVLFHFDSREMTGEEIWEDYYYASCRKPIERAEGKEPVMSVIIPSKDNPLVLQQCIDALLRAADGMTWELLVIDNGSSTENRARIEKMLEQYGTQQEPQHGIQQEPQHGTQHESQHGTQHGIQQEPQHDTQHESQHGTQQEPQHGTQQEPQHGIQQEPQHGIQQEPQHGTQQEPQHGTQQEPQHGTQHESQHGIQQEPQHGTQHGIQQEPQHEVQYASQPYRITYLYQPMEFHFSRMCNLGAAKAEGEVLLFLNDDVEVTEQTGLSKLVEQARLPYTGAVGVKLYYPSSCRMQHAGITNLPMGPVHKLQFLEDNQDYYGARARFDSNVLAVTGACLMVERERFREAGGFPEELPVAFNDVALCFALRELGYFNVVKNTLTAYHHESLSRGADESPEKLERLIREREKLYELHPRWKGTDPYYPDTLNRDGLDTRIRPAYVTSGNCPQIQTVLPEKASMEKYRLDECVLVRIEYCGQDGVQGYAVVLGDNNACYEKWLVLRRSMRERTMMSGRQNGLIELTGQRKKNAGVPELTGQRELQEPVYRIPLRGQYRPDLEENMPDQSHVALSGFQIDWAEISLPEGNWQLGIAARNRVTGLRLINWSNRSIYFPRN